MFCTLVVNKSLRRCYSVFPLYQKRLTKREKIKFDKRIKILGYIGVNSIHKRPTVFDVRRRFYSDYFRHKYKPELEALINEQINIEFCAGYTYLNIATYYGRSDVSFPGLQGYFMKMFYEELEHGMDFIKYQTMRGGTVKLTPLKVSGKERYSDIAKTFCLALNMEKDVKDKLVKISMVASKFNDTNVSDYVDAFIANQEKSIQEMSRYFTRISNLSKSPVGQYLFDRELHQTHVRKDPTKHEPVTANIFYS